MVKTTIKLYASGTSTADNVASAIIPVNAQVMAVGWNCSGQTGAGGSSVEAQLSVQSTGQFSVNDTRNIISECSLADPAVSGYPNLNYMFLLPGYTLKAGDRIYIHRLQIVAWTSLRVNVTVVLT